ncbi:MAG: extracellular solute-binding protein, partial [Lachnospiraceae bacterium]|nr:extracellular solute-binding protein [Lachnospiraceae bacterium]
MRFRKITALLMAAAMTASLAACGSGSGNATTEPAAEETKTQEAADDGAKEEEAAETADASGEKIKMTVSVWDNASSPQFQSMADAFMEKHPEVEVELIDTQADEYDNKLTVMLAGGDSDPDVIMVKNAETQVTMKDKNQLLDLTDYIARDGIDLSLYNGAAEQLQMDGKQYTLPFRQDWYML